MSWPLGRSPSVTRGRGSPERDGGVRDNVERRSRAFGPKSKRRKRAGRGTRLNAQGVCRVQRKGQGGRGGRRRAYEATVAATLGGEHRARRGARGGSLSRLGVVGMNVGHCRSRAAAFGVIWSCYTRVVVFSHCTRALSLCRERSPRLRRVIPSSIARVCPACVHALSCV